MNRQYIGARYVPKIFNNNGSNEWVRGITYEALTVVTYFHNSYISAKPVPSNVDAPNVATDYWACTGDVNSLVTDLQEQVTALDGDVDELQGDVRDIENTLSSFNDRYFIIQGDSYSLADYYEYNSFSENLIEYLGLTTNYTLLSNDGGGFVQSGTHGTFLQQLTDNPLTANVTDIIVAAGANDRDENATTLYNNIKNYITTAKTMYPNAKIYIAMIGWSTNHTYQDQIMTTSYDKYKNSAIENGAIWIEEATYSLLFGSDFTDYLHPSEIGAKKIAKNLANALNHQNEICTYDNEIDLTLETGITGDQVSFKLLARQRGSNVELCFVSSSQNVKLLFSTPTSISPVWKKIATLSNAVYVNGAKYAEFDTNCILRDSSNIYPRPITFRILGNELYCSVVETNNNIESMSFPAVTKLICSRNIK